MEVGTNCLNEDLTLVDAKKQASLHPTLMLVTLQGEDLASGTQ